MNFNEFLNEIKNDNKFKYLKIEKPKSNENLISYSGDIIGETASSDFIKIAKRYGYIALANHLNTWKTEEFYNQFKNKNE